MVKYIPPEQLSKPYTNDFLYNKKYGLKFLYCYFDDDILKVFGKLKKLHTQFVSGKQSIVTQANCLNKFKHKDFCNKKSIYPIDSNFVVAIKKCFTFEKKILFMLVTKIAYFV